MPRTAIYLDYAASTPVRPEVLEAMLPYWTADFGNPASVHRFGQAARQALEHARGTIADLLGAQPDEIIFTGCGSESDNLALRGLLWAAREQDLGNHFITSSIEHKAVLDTAKELRDRHGFDLTILAVDEFGQVDPTDVRQALRPETVLISIMAANNEIGAWQPVAEIGALAQERGIWFHSDAIQTPAFFGWNVAHQPIDLLSLSPHKFYGPKGVGILYARHDVPLRPTLTGGGQEEGRRAGTVNVPFAVGAATALALAQAERDEVAGRLQPLRDRLIDQVLAALPADVVCLTGHPTARMPNNASFAFRDLSGNELLMHLDLAGVAASSGSACLTGDPKPSAVLEAIGLEPAWTKGGLRFTLGRFTTQADVDYVANLLPTIVERMQAFAARHDYSSR